MGTRLALEDAAVEIRRATSASAQSPFFFLVGAGISYPSIPLAGTITAECAAKYDADRLHFPSLQAPRLSPRDLGLEPYSHYFELAYPQPAERAEYLNKLIHGKPISGATLRLAHLLASSKLARLVITPNFDDHLERALNLFGESFIVCDHPLTTARINPDRTDVIQIVHVHGTYWFYDCCNLKYEVAAQAQGSDHELSSMPTLLAQVLSKRSPIVVGYSGWEEDLIMGTLRRKLSERTPYNIYWFCYSKSSYDNLPLWLQVHQNVRFIVPSDAERFVSEESPPIQRINAQVKGSSPFDGGKQERNLPAQRVFDTLIQVCEVEEPRLTADPLDFFSHRLRMEAGVKDAASRVTSDRAEADLYDFAGVVERIDRAARLERSDVSSVDKFIEELRSSVRRSDYHGAIELAAAKSININLLDSTQLDAYLTAVESAAQNIDADDQERLETAWTMVLVACKRLLETTSTDAVRLRLAQNEISFAEALEFGESNARARLIYERLIGDEHLARVRGSERVRITALISLAALKQYEVDYPGAMELYHAATAHEFMDSGDELVLSDVAKAFRGEANCALQLNDDQRATATYDRLLELFLSSTSSRIRVQILGAMRDRARHLNDIGRHEDVIHIAQLSEAIWVGEQPPFIRGTISSIRIEYALALFRKGEFSSALMTAEAAIKQSAQGRSPGLFGADIGKAYFVAVSALHALSRIAEAKELASEAETDLRNRKSRGVEAILSKIRGVFSDS